MARTREPWALILGASSGMGEATARALAAAGDNVCGIHLDFRAALTHVEELKADLAATGREVLFINMNAADDEKRAVALAARRERFDRSEAAGRHAYVRVVMHSLAFGSLVPFISDDPKLAVDRKKMEMTQDVMANSLVYWVQDLYRGGFLGEGSKIYAMTSSGDHMIWKAYGAVSAAKCALEASCRAMAVEMAPYGVRSWVVQAGITDTPAGNAIPGFDLMKAQARLRNPFHRLTTPEDVAEAIHALCLPGFAWANGEVIRVDGGEGVSGI